MMKQVQFFHWKLSEVDERIVWLAEAGYLANHVDISDRDRPKQTSKPDAYVIDLSRLPSHGRAVALTLRQAKSSRNIPLIFVGGAAEKVASVRDMFPDATYTDWSKIKTAISRAIAHPPIEPVVPKSESGAYSGTPLPKKLGIKAGSSVVLIDAPKQFEEKLVPLPDDVLLSRRKRKKCNLIIWFVESRSLLEGRINEIEAILLDAGLWIAWPKKASGVQTDVNEDLIRQHGLAVGLVDYKVCAINETWSGLKFARRKK